MSQNELVHKGVVKSMDDKIIKVSIIAESACASCKAKGVCGASEQEEKVIEIQNHEDIYSIGESVDVVLNQSLGFRALFLGYILPFLILISSLVIASLIINSQGIAGLIAISVLIPYYFFLYNFRDKLKKTFSFSLRKQYNFN